MGVMPVVVVDVELHVQGLRATSDDFAAGYALCMLSDIHGGPLTSASLLQDLAAQTLELGCRAVLLNGDIVEGTVQERAADLAPLLAVSKAIDGAYFIPGNHEYYNADPHADAHDWVTWWNSNGVRQLNNTFVDLPLLGRPLFRLSGL